MVKVALAGRSPVPSGRDVGRWTGSSHTLIRADGRELNLTDYTGQSGVFLTREGVRGLGRPPLQKFLSESPATDGEVFRDQRVKARQIALPVYVYCDSGSTEYLDWEQYFWSFLEPGVPFQWRVRTARSDRTLTCYYDDDSDHPETFDIPLRGFDRYVITATAHQPMWRRTTTPPMEWSSAAAKPFFGGVEGGYGPPFYLGQNRRLEDAVMANNGDVKTWPKWTIIASGGPVTTATVGVAGVTTTINHTIATDDYVTLDADPDHRGLFNSAGEFLPGALTQSRFASIPPGVEVPLQLSIDNPSATVRCHIDELYYRGRGVDDLKTRSDLDHTFSTDGATP